MSMTSQQVRPPVAPGVDDAREPKLTMNTVRDVVNQKPILVFAGLAIVFCAFVL